MVRVRVSFRRRRRYGGDVVDQEIVLRDRLVDVADLTRRA